MPSISQQDYIYIEVGGDMTPSKWSSEVKKQIAKAIDNGVGLDVVLRERFDYGVNIVDSRVLCAMRPDDGTYYVAFWNFEADEMGYLQFKLEENNEEA